MATNRLFGLAGVCARSVAAGTIASSNGRASVAPAPLRTVRRGIRRFARNIAHALPELISSCRLSLPDDGALVPYLHVHLEGLALDNADDERRETVVASGARPHD